MLQQNPTHLHIGNSSPRMNAGASLPVFCEISSQNIMIAATHNHAGPAITKTGIPPRQEEYLATMKEKVSYTLAQAMKNLEPAKVGIASGFEGRISFNRRYVMKDGTERTHPPVASPQSLYAEGPNDPELGVVCVRNMQDKTLGYVVNFACHPIHFGGGRIVSAGYPGSLARHVKAMEGDDCICLFLNGASGNIHHTNPIDPNYDGGSPANMEFMGKTLAEDIPAVVKRMEFVTDLKLAVGSRNLKLPLRDVTPKEIDDAKATLAGKSITTDEKTQRFAPDEIYAESILQLAERKKNRPFAHAEIQAIRLGDAAFVAIPAEYFVENGFKIKLSSPIRPTYIISCANGMVGYVPHRAAFQRGGYETTTALWSKLVPEAGDIMADAVVEVLNEISGKG